jgi:hypothetical protein
MTNFNYQSRTVSRSRNHTDAANQSVGFMTQLYHMMFLFRYKILLENAIGQDIQHFESVNSDGERQYCDFGVRYTIAAI